VLHVQSNGENPWLVFAAVGYGSCFGVDLFVGFGEDFEDEFA
jgi:hypothetical protein